MASSFDKFMLRPVKGKENKCLNLNFEYFIFLIKLFITSDGIWCGRDNLAAAHNVQKSIEHNQIAYKAITYMTEYK
jgi:hypothetical protein